MDLGLGILFFSILLLGINQFFPSRNRALGLRLPFVFKSVKIWQRAQQMFYVRIIFFTFFLYLLRKGSVLTDLNYTGACILSILVAGMSTIFVEGIKNFSKKKREK